MPADAAASSPSVPDLQHRIEMLEAELHARTLERDEATRQQAAAVEVLEVINSSPGNLGPVFEALLDRALNLCSAAFGVLWTYDGEYIHAAAIRGATSRYMEFLTSGPHRPGDPMHGRLLRGSEVEHIADMADSDDYRSGEATPRALVDLGGGRSRLAIALRKEDVFLGDIVIYRREVQPFSEKEIALLRGFAAQAVIAMENARLLGELRQRTDDLTESLEYQTATSEVLEVIGRSTSDIQPVLDTLLASAAKLCGTRSGVVAIRQDDCFRRVATLGFTPETDRILRDQKIFSDRQSTIGRTLFERQVVHIVDVTEDLDYDLPGVLGEVRSVLGVPLMRDGEPIGVIGLARDRVEPFTDRQIALIRTFADQAVIAMENARLLTELRESLDQQTATADILKVIAASPSDVQPVFDAIAERSNRLIRGLATAVYGLVDDMVHLKSFTSVSAEADAALRAMFPRPLSAPHMTLVERAVRNGQVTQMIDAEDELDGDMLALARLRGWRSVILVPLIHAGIPIGIITVTRAEPGSVADSYVELLETFAAQAVIAIQNAKLFSDLREALEQQTATAEILRVISQSPTDVQPVLKAVARAAQRFCGARDVLIALRDGEDMLIEDVVPDGSQPDRRPLTDQLTIGRAILESRTVHQRDIDALDPVAFAHARAMAQKFGYRAAAAAPMLREGVAIGSILLTKPAVGPFTSRQIELLEAFAAQAVIAIENVRLFTELREALEQQTATAEILRAISQSPTDVQPVLDAVAKAAVRFCGSDDMAVGLRDGHSWYSAAHVGPFSSDTGRRFPLVRDSMMGRVMIDAQTLHVPDVTQLDQVEFAGAHDFAARHGFRAALVVPMLRDGAAIGALNMRRLTLGPFTPRQIELLETFAAQAVIAIENVRLFTELRDSLERLKAAQANLIQAEKMASLGQLTAGIAHEIKNPLNFVNNFAGLSGELLEELKQGVEVLLAAPDDGKRADLQDTMDLLTGNLTKILEHGRRADGIVKSMLAHSRGGTGDWQTSNINSLVEEALNLAYHGARAQDQSFNVTLERDFGEALKPIDLVPQDITRVLLNLFSNGFYSTRKRQRENSGDGYQPSLRVSTRDHSEAVDIRVRDNGTGIAPEVRAKLFQPFFTTKPTGEGTGLGLSISYDIVTQQHGGTIEVESEVGQFTEFVVRLPRARRVAT